MIWIYLFCITLVCHVKLVTSKTSVDAKNLRTQLFVTDAYDKRIIPVTNQSDPVEVYVNFHLLAINSLDEVNEILKTTGYLYILWYDGFLTWTPATYGGVEHYFWPQDDVWKPDIALKNSYKQYKELGVASLNVQVEHTGYVHWKPFQVFESTCSMNIQNFPFDVQECALKFVAWSYSKEEIDMHGGVEGLVMDEYEQNTSWDIVFTSWTRQEESGEASIYFNIKMKRKPLFVILSIILPISLLAILNIFVFVLPCESGERAGYAVTVFLSLAVFLTIVSSTLPANSDTVAWLSVYLIIQTIQSTMITLIALLTLRLYSLNSETKIPKCLISLLKCSDRLRCKRKNKVEDADEQGIVKKINLGQHAGVTKGPEEKKKPRGLSMATLQIEPEEPEYAWSDVLHFLDVVCLIFFTIVYVSSTVVCFGVSATADG